MKYLLLFLTTVYSFSLIPLHNNRVNNKLRLNCNNNKRMLNIHNAFLQNISKISYEKMVETNKTIKHIYILYNYDLLLKDYDNNLFLYNNINRTNIFYDFDCNLSFISLKYLYLIITKQF